MAAVGESDDRATRSGTPEGQPIRYEATLHPGTAGRLDASRAADLDLDRVPDPKGRIRVLIEPQQIHALVAAGVEVRLHRAVPIQPLDSRLLVDDDSARGWLDRRLAGLQREAEGGP